MKFAHVCLESLAVALPEEVWTSAEIEERLRPLYERLNLPAGRLELMTGIRARRMWPAGTRASDASAAAGRAVLARVRSTREPVAGRLTLIDGVVGVALDTLEEGVAPGQACVLYAPEDPSRVLGGGFIERAVRAV